jgi:hypothetical protein
MIHVHATATVASETGAVRSPFNNSNVQLPVKPHCFGLERRDSCENQIERKKEGVSGGKEYGAY